MNEWVGTSENGKIIDEYGTQTDNGETPARLRQKGAPAMDDTTLARQILDIIETRAYNSQQFYRSALQHSCETTGRERQSHARNAGLYSARRAAYDSLAQEVRRMIDAHTKERRQ